MADEYFFQLDQQMGAWSHYVPVKLAELVGVGYTYQEVIVATAHLTHLSNNWCVDENKFRAELERHIANPEEVPLPISPTEVDHYVVDMLVRKLTNNVYRLSNKGVINKVKEFTPNLQSFVKQVCRTLVSTFLWSGPDAHRIGFNRLKTGGDQYQEAASILKTLGVNLITRPFENYAYDKGVLMLDNAVDQHLNSYLFEKNITPEKREKFKKEAIKEVKKWWRGVKTYKVPAPLTKSENS